jgi:hypothetical protein
VTNFKKTGGIRGDRKPVGPFYPSGRPGQNEYDGVRMSLRDYFKPERQKARIRVGSNAGVSDSSGIVPFPGESELVTLSATLTDNSTTNVNVALAAEVSKVHIEYDATHTASYREVGALDVIVDGANGLVVNVRKDTAGSSGLVFTDIAADQNGGYLRLNLTVDSHGSDGDFKATCVLVASH